MYDIWARNKPNTHIINIITKWDSNHKVYYITNNDIESILYTCVIALLSFSRSSFLWVADSLGSLSSVNRFSESEMIAWHISVSLSSTHCWKTCAYRWRRSSIFAWKLASSAIELWWGGGEISENVLILGVCCLSVWKRRQSLILFLTVFTFCRGCVLHRLFIVALRYGEAALW